MAVFRRAVEMGSTEVESDVFQDAADATYQVAGDLYGAGSDVQTAVNEGWNRVGISVSTGGPRRGRGKNR